MEVKIPLYSKKNNCISCSVVVGSKAIGQVKKANSVEVQKALEFWITQQVVVHSNDHKLCTPCYHIDNVILKSKLSSNTVDLGIILELLTKHVKKECKIRNTIDE